MRQNLDIPHLDELLADMGLVEVNVKSSSGQVAALQRSNEGILVNQFAAGNVDDLGALLHLCNSLSVEERLAGERRRDQDAVSGGEQVVDVLVVCRVRGLLELGRHADDVVVQDLHVVGAVSLLCDSAPDPSEANNAQAEAIGVARDDSEVLVGVDELVGVA